MVRVRFAPSPTGPIHIGGVRTALYNYLYKLNKKGEFVLRIEDTDYSRKVRGAEEYIYDVLDYYKIKVDEGPREGGGFGPYRQSERRKIYNKYINLLIEKGLAYYCFTSKEELVKAREKKDFSYNSKTRMKFKNSITLDYEESLSLIKKKKYVVRLKVEGNIQLRVTDLLRGTITVNSNNLEDKILMKNDGLPTYHFANVVDDHLMKITTIIRGEEWLPSLPIHKLIYDGFGWDMPSTVHLPLILNPSGSGKLSKRDALQNNYSIFPIKWEDLDGLKEKGLLPDVQLAYISQLGSSFNSADVELDLNKMSKKFNLSALQKGGARFDFDKVKSLNQKSLSEINSEFLMSEHPRIFKKLKLALPVRALEIVDLIKTRVALLTDFELELKTFIADPLDFDESVASRILNSVDLVDLNLLKICIQHSTNDSIKNDIYKISMEKKLNFGKIMQFLRLSLVGNLSGPDVFFIIKMIGKNVTLRRLNSLLEKLKKQ
ncbi:glutamate--tRNA ligase [Bacteroidota bacterium]|nr:glutamate--tRNA ligase [Bacteroidota bacterium]